METPVRYRARPFLRAPLGGGQFLLRSSDGVISEVVPETAVRVLDAAQEFRTLEDHAAFMKRALPELANARAEDLVPMLASMAEERCLVSEPELFRRRSPPRAPTRIATLAVPTCGRPELLERALESYLANARDHGRELEVFVSEDSRDRATAARTREITARVAREHGARAYYADRERRRLFAARLAAEAGVPPPTVQLGLFEDSGLGGSIGANRNSILLHTVGEAFFSADDDTVCAPARLPRHARRADVIVGATDAEEYWCFPSREEALAFVEACDADLIGAHEALLGRPLDHVLAELGSSRPVRVGRACAHLVEGLVGAHARVAVTLGGVVGDSGMHSGALLLWPEGGTLGRLLASEQAYMSAFRSREIVRAAPGLSFSHHGPVTSTALGIDNRDWVPPFVPVLRGEDTGWSQLLTQVFDDAVLGYPEEIVLHAPEEARAFQQGAAVRSFASLRMCDLLLSLVALPDGWTDLAGPRARLHAIGVHLAELGREPIDVVRHRLKVESLKVLGLRVARWEEIRHAQGAAPSYWKRDAEACLVGMRDVARREDGWIPVDVAERIPGERVAHAIAALLAGLGDLLVAWPAIVTAAKRMRGAGERLGEALTT
jgi:hypothetical protein